MSSLPGVCLFSVLAFLKVLSKIGERLVYELFTYNKSFSIITTNV
jgi:hypothetical protein